MIRRFQALGYRCLRYVDLELDDFQVLVGANASGKSTLFDALTLLRNIVWNGLHEAVDARTDDPRDLIWDRPRKNGGFELAVEFDIPKKIRRRLPGSRRYRHFRYEISVRQETNRLLRIDAERGLLMPARKTEPRQLDLFPEPRPVPDTILLGARRPGHRSVLSKTPGGRDSFYLETSEDTGKGWATNIALGPWRSALGNLPESEEKFPTATWVKHWFLGIETFSPNGRAIASPSHPGKWRHVLNGNGSNLAWVLKRFRKRSPAAYDDWLSHVQTALPELKIVRGVEDRNDRHAHLVLEYDSGLKVPSWAASEGTLRLLALTLLAYLPTDKELYCVEEPENGIHPKAIDSVYDSLYSVYDAQILVSTHSPAILRRARPEQILCFAQDGVGATDIVRGDRHPVLRNWQDEVDTTALFAFGVIG